MTSINLHTFLRARRSIRRFKPDAVPDSVLSEILQTAAFAPSAHHRQPWRFFLLTEKSAQENFANAMVEAFKKELHADGMTQNEIEKRAARSYGRMTSAPVVVILSLDMSEMNAYPDRRRKKAEYIIATQSVANAGLQLLLAAHAEGLGGVWICSPMFAQETVQKALKLPGTWEPQAMFLIGYPAETPQPRERKPLHEIVKNFPSSN